MAFAIFFKYRAILLDVFSCTLSKEVINISSHLQMQQKPNIVKQILDLLIAQL